MNLQENKNQEKEKLSQDLNLALNLIYSTARKAGVSAEIHEQCTEAAKFIAEQFNKVLKNDKLQDNNKTKS